MFNPVLVKSDVARKKELTHENKINDFFFFSRKKIMRRRITIICDVQRLILSD